jgi:hypothetical protein
MSELAFNINGERFDLPESASYWRVRRFKASGRGTPEVVYADDGLPLIIPVETEIAEFRKLVHGVHGRYRLDPVNDNHKTCDEGQAAYLQLNDEPPMAATVAGGSRNDGGDDLLREIVRANFEGEEHRRQVRNGDGSSRANDDRDRSPGFAPARRGSHAHAARADRPPTRTCAGDRRPAHQAETNAGTPNTVASFSMRRRTSPGAGLRLTVATRPGSFLASSPGSFLASVQAQSRDLLTSIAFFLLAAG